MAFNTEDPSPPITPEREAARQQLNAEKRKMLEAMERDLGRPLTEGEEHLVLDPGALIEQPKSPEAARARTAAPATSLGVGKDPLLPNSPGTKRVTSR